VGVRSGKPLLLVNATELLRQPGTRRHVETAVPLAELEIDDDRLSGDVTVDVVLESTIEDIGVSGELRVAWSDSCRRCLRPISEVLTVSVDERYAEDDPTGHRRVDPEAFPIEHGQIDLAPMARAEVLLGIPDAALCEPDCPGLCPVCGADLRAGPCGCSTDVRDERWAALDVLAQSDPSPRSDTDSAAQSATDPVAHEPGDSVS
jgi:uncharacterized protein